MRILVLLLLSWLSCPDAKPAIKKGEVEEGVVSAETAVLKVLFQTNFVTMGWSYNSTRECKFPCTVTSFIATWILERFMLAEYK